MCVHVCVLCCSACVCFVSHTVPLQVFLQVVQAILIGWLTSYFVSDVTPGSTRDAYLTALALAFSVIAISWVHAWSFLWAQELGECVGVGVIESLECVGVGCGVWVVVTVRVWGVGVVESLECVGVGCGVWVVVTVRVWGVGVVESLECVGVGCGVWVVVTVRVWGVGGCD